MDGETVFHSFKTRPQIKKVRRACVTLDSGPLHRDFAGSFCVCLHVSVPFDTVYGYPPLLEATQQMDETT